MFRKVQGKQTILQQRENITITEIRQLINANQKMLCD